MGVGLVNAFGALGFSNIESQAVVNLLGDAISPVISIVTTSAVLGFIA